MAGIGSKASGQSGENLKSSASSATLTSARSEVDLMAAFGGDEDDLPFVGDDGVTDQTREGCCGGVLQRMGEEVRFDVIWLEDDGGLSVLLPLLLTRCRRWRGAKLRIIVVGRDQMQLVRKRESVEKMMDLFRVPCEVDAWHNDPDVQLKEETIRRHQMLEVEMSHSSLPQTSRDYLRVGEMIQEKCSDAGLVFITLPVPRVSQSPRQYMAYLQALARVSKPKLHAVDTHELVPASSATGGEGRDIFDVLQKRMDAEGGLDVEDAAEAALAMGGVTAGQVAGAGAESPAGDNSAAELGPAQVSGAGSTGGDSSTMRTA